MQCVVEKGLRLMLYNEHCDHTYPRHYVPLERDVEWYTPQIGALVGKHKWVNGTQLLELEQCCILW